MTALSVFKGWQARVSLFYTFLFISSYRLFFPLMAVTSFFSFFLKINQLEVSALSRLSCLFPVFCAVFCLVTITFLLGLVPDRYQDDDR